MSIFAKPPETLKSISYFFKLAEDHEEKYIAVSYWCAFHALKRGLEINAKEENAETTVFMKNILKWLEDVKKNNPENLAITDDKEAAKLILDFVDKYLTHADNKEKSGVLDKTVSKGYYNAAMLIDVMGEFGDIDQNLLEQQKFAKHKTILVHKKSLSNSQTTNSKKDDSLLNDGNSKSPKSILKSNSFSSESQSIDFNLTKISNNDNCVDDDTKFIEPDPIREKEAKKYCRFAESAISFQDYHTAIGHLEKALEIIKSCTQLKTKQT